ncbi:hypothetical protein PybrP1_008309 [[Pythium] brassicae (nom. inval.)]|nr:hypothetical protein PybrP1_008309 [[Pythium] brassicae (nom. inval.)]
MMHMLRKPHASAPAVAAARRALSGLRPQPLAQDSDDAVVLAFADGASRGNPGKSGCGALLMDAATKRVLAAQALYLGERDTNNSAEYQGLLLALRLARSHDVTRVHVHMDSELVVRQMTGVYRVKAPHLRGLYAECQQLCGAFERVTFSHVRREANADADRLANEAIDAHEQQQEKEESAQ